jgi:hypothetical protein
LPSGAFAVTLDEPATERTIDTDLGTLVVEAVEERLAYEEALHELPSLESQPQVKVGKGFFEIQFNPVERQTLARAQQAKTLGQLVDRVPATDLEVAQSIVSLLKLAVMTLKEPVQRVHVFTDSTADLIPAEARRMGITLMAVSIIFGRRYRRHRPEARGLRPQAGDSARSGHQPGHWGVPRGVPTRGADR